MNIENFLYIVLVLGSNHAEIMSKVLPEDVANDLLLEPRDEIAVGRNDVLMNILLRLDQMSRRKGMCFNYHQMHPTGDGNGYYRRNGHWQCKPILKTDENREQQIIIYIRNIREYLNLYFYRFYSGLTSSTPWFADLTIYKLLNACSMFPAR